MANNGRKPIYKKWWFWVLAILLLFMLTNLGDDEGNQAGTDQTKTGTVTEEKNTNEATDNQPAEIEAEPPPPVKEDTDAKIDAGTYKVGTELPAGEYLVFADGFAAYLEASSDSTGTLESIIFNHNLMNDAHTYVTLNDGEYFKVQGGYMYPVAEAPSVKPENGVYKDGMYKVGPDIPAGEYKVTLTAASGMGYLEVANDSRHQIGSIVSNENVTADTYITVSDGQYLTLQGLEIQQ